MTIRKVDQCLKKQNSSQGLNLDRTKLRGSHFKTLDHRKAGIGANDKSQSFRDVREK